jgi:hypothetical protein
MLARNQLLGYESVCLIVSCWMLHNGNNWLAAASLILSLLVWLSHFGMQMQGNEIEQKEKLD